jgi:hypothetical protein
VGSQLHLKNLLWKEPRLELVKATSPINPPTDSHLAIEMTIFESSFLSGLIRMFRPHKICEIGVSAGGTTSIILKTITMLNLDCHLHSIDVSPTHVVNKTKLIGYIVDQFASDLKTNWSLYLGKVSSVPLKTIGNEIDFCILDTMHIMPGEVLDFIAVFPYLTESAIVVLHDTSRQFDPDFGTNFHRYATTALFSSVTAEKIIFSDIPRGKPEGFPNITAFRVNSDTKKYISDVFIALSLPWTYLPSPEHLNHYYEAMYNFYSLDLIEYFKRATNTNLRMRNIKPMFPMELKKPILINTLAD